MIVELLFRFAVPIVISLIITPYIIRLAHRIGAIDQPNERKVHKNPTPRLGGLAIYLSFIPSYIMLFYFQPSPFAAGSFGEHKAIMLGISLTFVLLVGIWDDIKSLTPGKKLLGQIMAATIIYMAGFRITFITHPFNLHAVNIGLLEYPSTILWIVGVTNAFNLIDGLDGLASGVGVIVSLTIALIASIKGEMAISLIALLLAGAIIGFFHYNFNKAKIFLGDSGSLFIGFCLAILSMSSSTKGSAAFSILVPILLLGLPIIDTFLAMIRRLLRSMFTKESDSTSLVGKLTSVLHPDRGHIHHRLIELGFSHRAVVLLLYVVTCCFGIGAFAVTVTNTLTSFPILLTIGIATFIGVSQLRYKEMAVLRNGTLLPMYEWPLVNSSAFQGFLDLAFIIVAYGFAYFLSTKRSSLPSFDDPFFKTLTLLAAIQLTVFYLGGLYKGIYRRLGMGDLLKLFKVVGIAVLLTWSVISMCPREWNSLTGTLIILDFYIVLSLIMGSRVSFHVLNYLSRKDHQTGGKRVLIYGADERGALIIQQLLHDRKNEYCPVGFLDDDPQLEGKRVNDYPVFGGHWKIARLLKTKRIDEILISESSIKPEVMKRLVRISQASGVKLCSYKVLFEDLRGKAAQAYLQTEEPEFAFTVSSS